MAKRKKKAKKQHRRRRSVSGMKLNVKNPLVMFAVGGIAGYLVADQVDEKLSKATGSIDGKIVGGAEVAAGIITKMKVSKSSPIGNVIAGMLVGIGAKKLAHEMGVISGVLPTVNGFADMRRINGAQATFAQLDAPGGGMSPALSVISGIEDGGYTDR
jgi:hypothetical protein